MTPKEKAGMRLIAIKNAIAATKEGVRILESEEKTAQRDIQEAVTTTLDAVQDDPELNALMKRLADMPTNQAEDSEQPRPAIEVFMEMRQLEPGRWIAGPAVGHSHSTRDAAMKDGNVWLASFGDRLGVKFVPNWEPD